jgi:hypothetical protein
VAGNSESYTKRIESMRANLAVDQRSLEEMQRTGAKRDLFGRDRATLLLEITQQKQRIRIAQSY